MSATNVVRLANLVCGRVPRWDRLRVALCALCAAAALTDPWLLRDTVLARQAGARRRDRTCPREGLLMAFVRAGRQWFPPDRYSDHIISSVK